jgi:hypothetical protein
MELDYRDQPITSTRSIQTPYGEQDENGTDLSLIRSLMAMTPLERVRAGDEARRSALWLRQHARLRPQEPAGRNR